MIHLIVNDNFLRVCHCTWLIFIHHYPLLSPLPMATFLLPNNPTSALIWHTIYSKYMIQILHVGENVHLPHSPTTDSFSLLSSPSRLLLLFPHGFPPTFTFSSCRFDVHIPNMRKKNIRCLCLESDFLCLV